MPRRAGQRGGDRELDIPDQHVKIGSHTERGQQGMFAKGSETWLACLDAEVQVDGVRGLLDRGEPAV